MAGSREKNVVKCPCCESQLTFDAKEKEVGPGPGTALWRRWQHYMAAIGAGRGCPRSLLFACQTRCGRLEPAVQRAHYFTGLGWLADGALRRLGRQGVDGPRAELLGRQGGGIPQDEAFLQPCPAAPRTPPSLPQVVVTQLGNAA